MLTLTRKVGQRTFIGKIEVEVVEVRWDSVLLRVHGVEDESTIRLVDSSHEDTSRPQRPAPRRRVVAPSHQEGAPVVVQKRRTRRGS